MSDVEPAASVSSQYKGAAGDDYLEYQLRDVETANRIALPRFAPHVSSTDTVVDFGCGTGWLLRLLPGSVKLGIEPNAAARRVAESLGVPTVASAAEVGDAFADVVVSNHALEHSLSPYDELQSLRRILKPTGTLVLCLPIDDWRAQRRVTGDDPNHHLFTWTPLLLTNLLNEAGFDVTHVRAFTYLQPYYNDVIFPRVPRRLFDVMAWGFGKVMRYHQMVAVARPRA